MTVHFSKTERIEEDRWVATISPADFRKGIMPQIDFMVYDDEFLGEVVSINKSEITLFCHNGFPCVGREYKI